MSGCGVADDAALFEVGQGCSGLGQTHEHNGFMVGGEWCAGKGDVGGVDSRNIDGEGQEAGGSYDDRWDVNSGVAGVEKVGIGPDIGVDSGEVYGVPERTFFGLETCPGVPLFTLDGG